MNKENFTEEFTLQEDDLIILLRKLLTDGGKVIAEIQIDDLEKIALKLNSKKKNERRII